MIDFKGFYDGQVFEDKLNHLVFETKGLAFESPIARHNTTPPTYQPLDLFQLDSGRSLFLYPSKLSLKATNLLQQNLCLLE